MDMHMADLAPDIVAIRQHLDLLFRRCKDEYPGGMAEIVWTDDRGALTNAQCYFTDPHSLDMAARSIARVNGNGANCYVGVNPRKPGQAPHAKSDDIEVAFFQFADTDTAESVSALSAALPKLQCTANVVTGTAPNKRVQPYWELDIPCRNMAEWSAQQKGIAAAVKGDAVIDARRVMRIAGTINHPTQKKQERGYIPEIVTLRTEYKDGKRGPVEPEDIRAAFPPVYDSNPMRSEQHINQETPEPPKDSIFAEILRPKKVNQLIDAIMRGEQWHNNMARLTAHWIGRGWTDREVITAAVTLTLPGYTQQQTVSEVSKLIQGARKKWNTPEEDWDIEDEPEQRKDLLATPLGLLIPAKIDQRKWVMQNRLAAQFCTVTIAPGGLGKSTLTMEEMIAIATGRPLTGTAVNIQGATWIYNNEDPLDELHRRIAAICIKFDIDPAAIAETVHLNSGRDRPLIVARQTRDTIIQTPDVPALEAAIKERNIIALTIDPFVSVHEVNENDNNAIAKVAKTFSRIADRTGCAINLVHHTRKAPNGFESQTPGDADSSRGASALISDARVAHTLSIMSKDDAEQLNIPPERRRWFVRMDQAKRSESVV